MSGPVGSWLSELKNVHESECTIMLQSKPVRRSESENVQEGIADIKERIRLIQDRANLLSGLFASLCRLVLVTSSSLCSPPDAPSDTLIAGEAPLHTVNISLMPRNASGGAELVSVTGF